MSLYCLCDARTNLGEQSTQKLLLKSMADQKASGLVAREGLELLTSGMPNGHEVSIFLKELKEAYRLEDTVQSSYLPWTKYSEGTLVCQARPKWSYTSPLRP